jgi:hypothetical protein
MKIRVAVYGALIGLAIAGFLFRERLRPILWHLSHPSSTISVAEYEISVPRGWVPAIEQPGSVTLTKLNYRSGLASSVSIHRMQGNAHPSLDVIAEVDKKKAASDGVYYEERRLTIGGSPALCAGGLNQGQNAEGLLRGIVAFECSSEAGLSITVISWKNDIAESMALLNQIRRTR